MSIDPRVDILAAELASAEVRFSFSPWEGEMSDDRREEYRAMSLDLLEQLDAAAGTDDG